ncbi:GNAT family N-acetyltransferase [Roseibium sp. RKSG952]|uniref:GNAT family N-acetyltransferase n=1 Tax=Roseibium sp. RKSG952 TaxID=2529384 RepID=UPI0012BCF46C|nr:GNAT family N-acetyltransferase [Roseibium sp. RKSG952]MTH99736.1 GNAT family N-acetyltransferase [Roseibium sp. RKSG952]
MTYWWFWGTPPIIEAAAVGDLPALADIHRKSFPHAWDADELARMRAHEGTQILIARRPSPYGTRSVVGFLILRSAGDEAEVITIAVDPRHRGKGVAGALMKDGMFRLYADRCACLFLEVDAVNMPAVKLYRRLGFEKVGERKGYYRAGDGDGTALVMRADLR